MSKFSSFLVFVFGLFLMIAVAVIFTQKSFFPPPPAPPEERLVLPVCNLPSLEIGTREQFGTRLSKVALADGLDGVKAYVEKEIVPGRSLLTSDSAADAMEERRIVDREVRQCDGDGVAPLDKPPVVARASPNLHAPGNLRIQSWTRSEGHRPFTLTIWWVPGTR